MEDVRRAFAALEQAKENAKTAATGYHGTLRIALSDDISPAPLAALLAQCRAEEPEVEIRLCQIPFLQQTKGLRSDLFDAGLAQSPEAGEGVIAEAVWADPLVVALPARHPLLIYKGIPLEEVCAITSCCVIRKPVKAVTGKLKSILRKAGAEPRIVEYVGTHDLLLTLIAAGYGVGLTCSARVALCRGAGIVTRPLAGQAVMLTTYLLRPDIEPSIQLSHFIDRVNPVAPAAEGPTT